MPSNVFELISEKLQSLWLEELLPIQNGISLGIRGFYSIIVKDELQEITFGYTDNAVSDVLTSKVVPMQVHVL